MSELPARAETVRASAAYVPILLLVVLGAATKSAQFPFHFWLPNAMEAPTPVSAFLHSATMVKAGIYLLARLHPALGGTPEWTLLVTGLGAVTMLAGAFLALNQTDLKRILAYTTVSALGTLTLLLGLGSVAAAKAFAVFVLAHALYKGALFMIAGAVDHETGTRDVLLLGGLRTAMPVTALVAGLAAVSLAGIGPLFSFIGKEAVFEAVITSPMRVLLVPAVLLGAAVFVAEAAIVFLRAFLGPVRPTPKTPHEAPASLWSGPAVLAVLGVVFGVFPGPVARFLVAPAASSVLGREVPAYLALWHGFNAALAMSAAAFAAGLVLYLMWDRSRRFTTDLEASLDRGPARWYDVAVDGLNRLAVAQTRLLQNGSLRNYILTIVAAFLMIVGGTLLAGPVQMDWSLAGTQDLAGHRALTGPVGPFEVILLLLVLLGTATAVLSDSRLVAIAGLGAVGYGVALTFAWFGAPDLAMTQILAETLVVVFLVLAFIRLPRFVNVSPRWVRLRDGSFAILAGTVMTVLTLSVSGIAPDPTVAGYYSEQSVPAAHGRNIVNVILVDFRALDTLGEITVLAVAAVGVYALLRLRGHRREA